MGLQLVANQSYKCLDDVFVTLEEVPLTDLLAADQTSALQGRQVGGHCRLRQAGALVDFAGTDADFQ
jgi:hypothetical protein